MFTHCHPTSRSNLGDSCKKSAMNLVSYSLFPIQNLRAYCKNQYKETSYFGETERTDHIIGGQKESAILTLDFSVGASLALEI